MKMASGPTSTRQIRQFRIPFNEQTLWRIAEVLDSGMVMQGEKVQELEAKAADFLGVDASQVVAMNSGTSALEYALSVTPRKAFKVLVPGLAFISDIIAIEKAGLKPKIMDVGKNLQVNVEVLEDAYDKQVGGVLVVDYAGLPTDMKSIFKWAEERDLIIWQDCAHSWGSKPQSKPAGTISDFACYSLYPTKPLPGLGGGIFLNNLGWSIKRFQTRAREWRHYGFVKLKDGSYDVNVFGGNHYLNNVSATIALQYLQDDTLPNVGSMNRKRCQVARWYHDEIHTLNLREWLKPPRYEGDGDSTDATFHLFPVILNVRLDREQIRDALLRMGIESGTHYKPLHYYTLYMNADKAPTPYLDSIANQILTLPCHHDMTREDVKYVIGALDTILRNIK